LGEKYKCGDFPPWLATCHFTIHKVSSVVSPHGWQCQTEERTKCDLSFPANVVMFCDAQQMTFGVVICRFPPWLATCQFTENNTTSIICRFLSWIGESLGEYQKTQN
jgi:hypothetical protein